MTARHFDILIIGAGAAGLTAALNLAQRFKVAVLLKGEGATGWAQGGIAAVLEPGDSFEAHIEDTMVAGAGLNDRGVVEFVIESAPAAIRRLAALGVPFNIDDDGTGWHLTREGGHSARRIVHVDDATGWAIQQALEKAAAANPNISVIADMVAIDLVTGRNAQRYSGDGHVWGAYALNKATGKVETFTARATVLATGGAGRVYLFFDRAQRRDRRRHRDGLAGRGTGLQHGIHAVPPDLPLQSQPQELPDHRGGPRRGRAAEAPGHRPPLHAGP